MNEIASSWKLFVFSCLTFVCVCVCEIAPPPHQLHYTYGRRDLFFFRSTRLPTPSSTFLFFFILYVSFVRLVQEIDLSQAVGSSRPSCALPRVLCFLFFFFSGTQTHRGRVQCFSDESPPFSRSFGGCSYQVTHVLPLPLVRYLHQFQSPLEQPKGIRNERRTTSGFFSWIPFSVGGPTQNYHEMWYQRSRIKMETSLN